MVSLKEKTDFLKSVLPHLRELKSLRESHQIQGKPHIIIEGRGFHRGKYEIRTHFASIKRCIEAGAPEKIAKKYRSFFIIYKDELLRMIPVQNVKSANIEHVDTSKAPAEEAERQKRVKEELAEKKQKENDLQLLD